MALIDNHGRIINYLRLAVTDRCNLRCHYCMPAHGLDWLSRAALLTYEEMIEICRLLSGMGIEKVRITGGEPFVRKDMMRFLHALSQVEGIKKIHITTNGVVTAPLVPELIRLGIDSVNLSLDTLDPARFLEITRRNEFHQVMQTLESLLMHGADVKINAVVMENINTDDILPLVALTKNHPVSVRFIEEMPFNGAGQSHSGVTWNYKRILQTIRDAYPSIQKVPDDKFATAMNYAIPGHRGQIGIIAAWSRTFCGTCNRIRITPTGMMKTCLYGDGVLNVRDLMRNGVSGKQMQQAIVSAINNRAINGWVAEADKLNGANKHESMAEIGG